MQQLGGGEASSSTRRTGADGRGSSIWDCFQDCFEILLALLAQDLQFGISHGLRSLWGGGGGDSRGDDVEMFDNNVPSGLNRLTGFGQYGPRSHKVR